MAIFNSYVSHYQRVFPIHNPIKPSFPYGFPVVFLWFMEDPDLWHHVETPAAQQLVPVPELQRVMVGGFDCI